MTAQLAAQLVSRQYRPCSPSKLVCVGRRGFDQACVDLPLVMEGVPGPVQRATDICLLAISNDLAFDRMSVTVDGATATIFLRTSCPGSSLVHIVDAGLLSGAGPSSRSQPEFFVIARKGQKWKIERAGRLPFDQVWAEPRFNVQIELPVCRQASSASV